MISIFRLSPTLTWLPTRATGALKISFGKRLSVIQTMRMRLRPSLTASHEGTSTAGKATSIKPVSKWPISPSAQSTQDPTMPTQSRFQLGRMQSFLVRSLKQPASRTEPSRSTPIPLTCGCVLPSPLCTTADLMRRSLTLKRPLG